jgi:hypothetical protein
MQDALTNVDCILTCQNKQLCSAGTEHLRSLMSEVQLQQHMMIQQQLQLEYCCIWREPQRQQQARTQLLQHQCASRTCRNACNACTETHSDHIGTGSWLEFHFRAEGFVVLALQQHRNNEVVL